ncbi:MAG: Arm DNA-binding domain-containing protein, partial [Xanthobacteraceae bacterium]
MVAVEKRWTDLTIKNIKPRKARFEEKAPGFPGLRLLVHPSGTKTFVFRYTFGATYKKLTLNAYVPDTGALAAAAANYKEAETELHNGRDPADLFKRKRAGKVADDDTVTAYLELYREQHVAQLAVTTQDYVKRELNLFDDKLGAKDIRKVTQDDVQKIIDGSINRKGRADGLAARNQTYKVAKQFFAWTANRAGIDSPCMKIEKPADDNIGERVLSDDEVKIVWDAATKAGPMHGGY